MDNLTHPQSMNCRTCRFFEQTDDTCRKNPPAQNPTYGYAWPQITRAPVPSGIYWCGQWVKHPDAVPVDRAPPPEASSHDEPLLPVVILDGITWKAERNEPAVVSKARVDRIQNQKKGGRLTPQSITRVNRPKKWDK